MKEVGAQETLRALKVLHGGNKSSHRFTEYHQDLRIGQCNLVLLF